MQDIINSLLRLQNSPSPRAINPLFNNGFGIVPELLDPRNQNADAVNAMIAPLFANQQAASQQSSDPQSMSQSNSDQFSYYNYSPDIELAKQKVALAQALQQKALEPQNTGLGGLIGQLGTAWFAKKAMEKAGGNYSSLIGKQSEQENKFYSGLPDDRDGLAKALIRNPNTREYGLKMMAEPPAKSNLQKGEVFQKDGEWYQQFYDTANNKIINSPLGGTPIKQVETEAQAKKYEATIRGQNLANEAANRRLEHIGEGLSNRQKPLPPLIAKQADDLYGQANIANNIVNKSYEYMNLINDGAMNVDLASRAKAKASRLIGATDESDLNVLEFNNWISGLRNDALRLAKGTQTEKDAARAMEEIITNPYDKKYVAARLKTIAEKMQLAAQQSMDRIEKIVMPYSAENPWADMGSGLPKPASKPTKPSEPKNDRIQIKFK